MSNSKPVIMAVDDDKETIKLFDHFLNKQGYEVLVANSVNEAITIFETRIPNIVLLDLMLPGANGEELLRHIRQTPNLAHIYVVIISAHEYDPRKLLSDGTPDVVVRKPIGIPELSAVIRKALAGT